MLKICYCILLGLLANGPLLSEDVAVEINSNSPTLVGTELLVDGDFVGVVGDVFRLPPGNYQASFQGKYRYEFSITLKVSQSSVQLIKNEARRWSHCVDGQVDRHTVKTWPSPEVRKIDAKGFTFWTVTFDEPQYEGYVEKQSVCHESPGLLMLRSLGSITLNLSSVPPGAAIYIQGKEEGATDKKLVVPFREREDAIRVVIRKPGYVSCATKIPLPASGIQEVHCALVAVPSSLW